MLCLVCQFKIGTLPFLFDFFELKERAHIRRKINSQRKVYIYKYIRNQYYYYFDLAKMRVGWPVQQKIKLPLPSFFLIFGMRLWVLVQLRVYFLRINLLRAKMTKNGQKRPKNSFFLTIFKKCIINFCFLKTLNFLCKPHVSVEL